MYIVDPFDFSFETHEKNQAFDVDLRWANWLPEPKSTMSKVKRQYRKRQGRNRESHRWYVQDTVGQRNPVSRSKDG